MLHITQERPTAPSAWLTRSGVSRFLSMVCNFLPSHVNKPDRVDSQMLQTLQAAVFVSHAGDEGATLDEFSRVERAARSLAAHYIDAHELARKHTSFVQNKRRDYTFRAERGDRGERRQPRELEHTGVVYATKQTNHHYAAWLKQQK